MILCEYLQRISSWYLKKLAGKSPENEILGKGEYMERQINRNSNI